MALLLEHATEVDYQYTCSISTSCAFEPPPVIYSIQSLPHLPFLFLYCSTWLARKIFGILAKKIIWYSIAMSGVALDEPQKTLFDIRTKAISPYWIDPTQDLLIPINPLHFEAHKCQLLLAHLEIQAE